MKTSKLKDILSMETMQDFLLEESFKKFIVSSLTVKQIEYYAEKYAKWFKGEYKKIKCEKQNFKEEFIMQNLILLQHMRNQLEDEKENEY